MNKIKLEYISEQGTMDISDLVPSITWSGEYTQAARKLEFGIVSSPYDKSIPKVNLELGKMVKFYSDGKELFRGYIFSKDKSYNGNDVSYTAYDGCIFLLKNEWAYNFKDVTAENIASKVCATFNLPVGALVKTLAKVKKKFLGVSLYDIIMTAYTIAASKTKKKYMCICKKGKISVIEKGKEVLLIKFENGSNIIDSNFSEDINDLVSKVVIVNDSGSKVAEAKNYDWIKKYGSFQKVMKKEEGKNAVSQANAALQGVTKKMSITGIGDTSCLTGCGVKVYDSYTGLTGLFYIDSDTHTWDNGFYSLDLNLNLQNMMDTVEAGEDEEKSSTGSSGGGGNSDNGDVDNSLADKIINYAKQFLGRKYVWGGKGPKVFDCSGFTGYVYKHFGLDITTWTQTQKKKGKSVSYANLQKGDLVFFYKGYKHVALYMGDGRIIHAANSKRGLVTDSIKVGSHYHKQFQEGRRVIHLIK